MSLNSREPYALVLAALVLFGAFALGQGYDAFGFVCLGAALGALSALLVAGKL